MKIACVIPTMQGGGAERVMSRLVAHWAGLGHEVGLFTLEPAGSRSFYPLPPTVAYRPLSLAGVSRGLVAKVQRNWRTVRGLRAALREMDPAVIVSFCVEMNVTTLAAARPLAVPVIVSERVDPFLYPRALFWKMARRFFYPRARTIVAQTNEANEYFQGWRGVRTLVIPNPVPEIPPADDASRGRIILAIGRLDPQKGFDLLLNAFAKVHRSDPSWKLRILGEGTGRTNLEQLVGALSLTDAVEMPGQVLDVAREYAAAGIFVLSSRYEGFPNVLGEAMAAGLPVVVFACRGGISDLVESDRSGLLVPVGQVDALADGIARVMADPSLRLRLGEEARLTARRYAPEKIFLKWDDCLSRAVQP